MNGTETNQPGVLQAASYLKLLDQTQRGIHEARCAWDAASLPHVLSCLRALEVAESAARRLTESASLQSGDGGELRAKIAGLKSDARQLEHLVDCAVIFLRKMIEQAEGSSAYTAFGNLPSATGATESVGLQA